MKERNEISFIVRTFQHRETFFRGLFCSRYYSRHTYMVKHVREKSKEFRIKTTQFSKSSLTEITAYSIYWQLRALAIHFAHICNIHRRYWQYRSNMVVCIRESISWLRVLVVICKTIRKYDLCLRRRKRG